GDGAWPAWASRTGPTLTGCRFTRGPPVRAVALVVLVCLLTSAAPAEAPAPRREEMSAWDVALRVNDFIALATRLRENRLTVRMTAAEVTRLLGTPRQKVRQLLYRRYREQWLYATPVPLCITFDCPKGEESPVLTVHPLSGAIP